jgi:hypothetical protein
MTRKVVGGYFFSLGNFYNSVDEESLACAVLEMFNRYMGL